MQITETIQMYLETILMLSQEGPVRSVDVANRMGYARPTVSEQMKRLREGGLIDMDESALIALTPAGRAVAEPILERHNLLARMLMSIGVSRETAFADACRMEHDISAETMQCLKRHFGVR